jgi:diguanylate cyclase (GGDEF)-like protein/hemerythrin-like metal-binding protein
MESFVWNECFVTGLPKVDEQHERLVALINGFGEGLMEEPGASRPQLEAVFTELADYARCHFQDEEALMARHHLDARYQVLHRREHHHFLLEVTRLHGGLAGSDPAAATHLQQFLVDWLAYHILGSDQDLARQIAAIDTGISPDEAFRTRRHARDPATSILLQSLDRLFHHVSERNRELMAWNQTLEARVAERTRELSLANQRLEQQASTDVLTGLANRRHAMLCLQADWPLQAEPDRSLACIMVDADGLKGVNDVYGHGAGDEVLRHVARALKGAARNDDTVCRLGGDEYLVISRHTTAEGALRLAEKLVQAVRELRVPLGSGALWSGSVSVGVALRQPDMPQVDALLRAADLALYQAKRAGRNGLAMAPPCGVGPAGPHRSADR